MTSRKLLRLLGELIRSARIARGLTQRALGERAGIVDKYVSEIERGTRDVPLSTLFAIVERGLGYRLAIRFEDADPAGPARLSVDIEHVALAIDRLPDDRRRSVLQVVNGLLELAR